jgi:GntR family transcriptional regulator
MSSEGIRGTVSLIYVGVESYSIYGRERIMETAFQIVQEKLLNIIRTQEFNGNKLFGEDKLIDILDASRGTVREVLRTLDRQGLITKKHGIGNYVHPRALNMRMRMDEISDFPLLIEDGGYKASLIKDEDCFVYSLPQEGAAEDLEFYLEKDREYYCFTRIFLADQQPAIYTKFFIPTDLFLHPPLDNVRYINLLDLVKRHLEQEIDQTMIWITSELANDKIAEKINVPPGTALIAWDEQFCNYRDEIIGYCKTYFNPRIMKVCMLRKSS